MIKLVPSTECEVRVIPSKQWMSGRSAHQEYEKCGEIQRSINGHVDDVGNSYIHQTYLYEKEDGTQFDTLYEALEDLFDEWGCNSNYGYRYVRPSDNGVGSRGTCYSFEKLIETAWQNPWEFTILERSTPLTEDQEKFLARVIEKSLSRKHK